MASNEEIGDVVEVAVLEDLDLAAATEVADGLDGLDRRTAGPVAPVGPQGQARAGLTGRDVAAAADEVVVRREGAGVVRAGRHDPERRSRDDVREVRRGSGEGHGDVAGRVIGAQAHGRRLRRPGEVLRGAIHDQQERRQRRRCRRVDQAEPAPHDVARPQRRPVGEREVGPKVEHDPGAVLVDLPRLGEGGLEAQVRVEGREGLEQLRRDRGARDVALRGRVQRGRDAGEDPGLAVRGTDAAGLARGAARHRQQQDQAERDGTEGGAAHRREYTGDRLDDPSADLDPRPTWRGYDGRTHPPRA